MGNIHDSFDNRNIKIESIGICKYKLPIVFESDNKYNSIATIQSNLMLGENVKGAHLSRIIKYLDNYLPNNIIKIKNVDEILENLRNETENDNPSISMNFDIVFPKKTPKSCAITYLNSNIALNGVISNAKICKSISLTSTGAMLCPNSKNISKYGAHSQKCNMRATLYGEIDDLSIEKVLDIIFSNYSAEVYGLVRSVDEKYMTEKAYENPKFSEDLVRDTLIALRNYYFGGTIEVEIENLESIHQHNVYCKGRL